MEAGSPKKKGLSTVLVDGDSAGHRKLLMELAIEFDAELVWVCNVLQSVPEKQAGLRLTVHQVDMHPQAADEKIMNLAAAGAVVVTGDLGLATVCIAKGAAAISPRGHWFWEDKLAQRMELRHLFTQQRRAGKRTHGPTGASHLDDERFEAELRDALRGEAS